MLHLIYIQHMLFFLWMAVIVKSFIHIKKQLLAQPFSIQSGIKQAVPNVPIQLQWKHHLQGVHLLLHNHN